MAPNCSGEDPAGEFGLGANQNKLFIEHFEFNYPLPLEQVKKDEIGGLDTVLEQLTAFQRAAQHPELYEYYGVDPPKGFIISSPPGTGKTYTAKYLAVGMGAQFMDLPLSSFESKYVGEAEQKLVKKIQHARYYVKLTKRRVLIFFDEAEEAFKSRQLGGWHGPRVNALLREMDGMAGSNDGLIYGAATNHIDRVDEAILRPGRMDYIITIPPYGPAGLADVVRATALRMNRRAEGPFRPFTLTPKEHQLIGAYAAGAGLTPAHINEAFKRAADDRIKTLCEEEGVMDLEDLVIGYGAVRAQIEGLTVPEGGVVVGFRG